MRFRPRTAIFRGLQVWSAPTTVGAATALLVAETALSVRMDNVSKIYGFLWALRDVRLEIGAGEWVGLLGPNGAGKTTLLRVLAALAYPTAGGVELFGQELSYGNSPLRRSVGFLASGAHLYDSLTVSENLRFFVSLYRNDVGADDRATVLNDVGLHEKRDEYVSALSLGMRCRLAIAKWRLVRPRLLLVDEPYGSLDPSGVEVLNRFLESTCAAGGIVVLATHDVPRLLERCTRAVMLDQGRIVFDEPRQDPWHSFHSAFDALLSQDSGGPR